MRKRFIKAVALVLIGACLLVVATFAVAGAQDYTVQAGQTYANKLWERMQKGQSTSDAMKSVGFKSLDQMQKDNIPSWFFDEIFCGDTTKKFDVYSNDDLSIVGFRMNNSIAEATPLVLDEFSNIGWQVLGAENAQAVTLMKEKGKCQWMMVEIVEYGEQTSVVLRIKHD